MKLDLNITDDELHVLVRQVVAAIEVARSDADDEIKKLDEEAKMEAANAVLKYLQQASRTNTTSETELISAG